MNIERLKTLRDFLSGFPEDYIEKKKFSLSSWMVTTDEAAQAREPMSGFTKIGQQSNRYVLEPNYCQTTGCAMGWATTIPEFKEAGLMLVTSILGDAATLCYRVPQGTTVNYNFMAAVSFFDISWWSAQILFAPHCYPVVETQHPKFVVARLQELIDLGDDQFRKKYSAYLN